MNALPGKGIKGAARRQENFWPQSGRPGLYPVLTVGFLRICFDLEAGGLFLTKTKRKTLMSDNFGAQYDTISDVMEPGMSCSMYSPTIALL